MTIEDKFELLSQIKKSTKWIGHKKGERWNGYKVVQLGRNATHTNVEAESINKTIFGVKPLGIVADDIWIDNKLADNCFGDKDIIRVYQ